MSEKQETSGRKPGTDSDLREAQPQKPVYQKPVLRKYDQIEQVKPYGPSELEAG